MTRGNRGRGRGRGGSRRGSGRGGRGGHHGSDDFTPFQLSKSLKRRSKANARKKAGVGAANIEGVSDFGPDIFYNPQSSMLALLKRPNKHMMNEARYTELHVELTMKKALRERPVEFIKAKEAYDPSKEMIEQLARKKEGRDELARGIEELRVEETEKNSRDAEKVTNEEEGALSDDVADLEGEIPVNEPEGPNVDKLADKDTELDAEVDEDDPESRSGFELPSQAIYGAASDEARDGSSSASLLESDPAELQSEKSNENIELVNLERENPEQEALEQEDHTSTLALKDEYSDLDASDFEAYFDEQFTIDVEGDQDILEQFGVSKVSSSVIRSLASVKPPPRATYEEPISAHLETSPTFTVGGVTMRTENVGRVLEASFPVSRASSILPDAQVDSDYDSPTDSAFEDYIWSVREHGDGFDGNEGFGHGETHDLGGDDIYFSDGLSQYESSDGASMDDAELAQALYGDGTDSWLESQFIKPTEWVNNRAALMFSQLVDEDIEMDLELREALLEQYQYQKTSRREKKLRKKERKKAEAGDTHDLRAKYEYALHVQDIKHELELLLHDETRQSVSFPPLDGHGNKTVNKLATCYNMACSKQGGNGLRMYMKVSKNRKTFHYLPDHGLVNYIMKQRPHFRRTDVAPRTKAEIEETDGGSGRRGPKSQAFYKEGDIVGEKAPEIDANNFGRKMLEKLGWVKGEGLGALGNKGISIPVMATVKKSKTGLR